MATRVLRKCSRCLSAAKRSRLLLPSVTRCYQTDSNDDAQTADIVISGGGMVGAAMACALGHDNMLEHKKVVLLEAGPKKQFSLGEKYSNRTCTLSPASIQLFDRCGAWEEIQAMRCQRVLRMQVWESCSNSLITFNQNDMSEELAYVAENDVILEALTQRLEAVGDRVQVKYNTRTDDLLIPGCGEKDERDTDTNTCVQLKLNNGETIKTKLLIGSDGMNSAVRKAANFHTVSFKYDQSAVVATLHISEMPNNVAWQRFLPTGPIALLPVTLQNVLSFSSRSGITLEFGVGIQNELQLICAKSQLSDTTCNLIWTTTPEEVTRLKSLTEDDFVDAVNDAFWHERDMNPVAEKAESFLHNLLQNIKPGGMSVRQLPPTIVGVQTDSRASFPLGLTHSSNYVRHRVALIGDAAHRMHPLAGQGVNLGFGDVAKLSEIITKAAYDGSDLGSLTYLKEYETARQRKVIPTMATIDGLQRLYSNDFTPLVVLRSLGLQATNAIRPLKEKIIEQATR